jgi:Cu(I)/Ag(I) efflux system protein CusF
MRYLYPLILTLLLSTAPFPLAMAQSGSSSAAATTLSDGEIRKIDRDAQKITIRHGPIENLDMPPMTMVFQVKDPDLLDRAKTGEKIRFTAERSGGAYIVTRIDPVK